MADEKNKEKDLEITRIEDEESEEAMGGWGCACFDPGPPLPEPPVRDTI